MSQRAEVGAGLTQVLGRWQRVLFVRLSNETTTEADGSRSTAFYVIPRHQLLDAAELHRRRQAAALPSVRELRGSPSTLGSDASFLQFRLQGERVFDFARAVASAICAPSSARLSSIDRDDFSTCRPRNASSPAATAACAASRSTSCRRATTNGDSIGGQHLATGTIEVERDLPRNFGVAAFYDIGNAFDDFSDPELEYSVGLGVRYNIAVASFGVDVAQPLSESGRNPRLHLYISTQF